MAGRIKSKSLVREIARAERVARKRYLEEQRREDLEAEVEELE